MIGTGTINPDHSEWEFMAMSDFDLYYWPMPFRGQLIRALLAYAGQSWSEHDGDEIETLMSADAADQPVPFMGPPILVDRRDDIALSQMPAIAAYLGDRLRLMPEAIGARAMTIKVVNDANDVIDELTLDGGREMWTREKWTEFTPRLRKWMRMWEALGEKNGLDADRGYLLGTAEAGVADIVTSTLWSTMSDRFGSVEGLFEESAPRTAGLTRRMQRIPALADLSKAAFEKYGDAYCGGEIEKSLRSVAT